MLGCILGDDASFRRRRTRLIRARGVCVSLAATFGSHCAKRLMDA